MRLPTMAGMRHAGLVRRDGQAGDESAADAHMLWQIHGGHMPTVERDVSKNQRCALLHPAEPFYG